MVTDWNSVFYRKAVIYKRRVDEELEMRRERSTTMSKSVSSNSSNFDVDVGMTNTNKRTSVGARQSLNFRSSSSKFPEPNFGPPADIGPIDT